MEKALPQIIRWVVILALPVCLILGTARLFFADWFPPYEYGKANFPPDAYGFSQSERVQLTTATIHFLNDPRPVDQATESLQALRLPGGQGPLYTPNEISHLVDVKRVTDRLWQVAAIAGLLAVAGLAVLLARPATRTVGWNALFGGGLFTVGLLVFLGLFVVLAFNTFFVTFHEVLFPQGNWTFNYSDSLIRLLPEMLWSDGATMIVAATLLEGVVLGVAGYLLGRRAA